MGVYVVRPSRASPEGPPRRGGPVRSLGLGPCDGAVEERLGWQLAGLVGDSIRPLVSSES